MKAAQLLELAQFVGHSILGCSQVRRATLDPSDLYRSVFDTMLPDAVQVADPFHVIKLANTKVGETRRRVQNETLGHRDRKIDPPYQIRHLLATADERLTNQGRAEPVGPLVASDPRGEVRTMWHAKYARPPRSTPIPTRTSPLSTLSPSAGITRDDSCPPEVRSLGRTIIRWKDQIAARPHAHVSNGPTEAANNLIQRITPVAFGFRRFRNYRVRTLLYAGQPNWNLPTTITPR